MRTIGNFALLIFVFVFVYFGYLGFTTPVWEGDSLAYHIPIATKLTEGRLGGYENWLWYYPASSHVILAGFVALGLPLGWFNLVGWVMFVGLVYRLMTRSGVSIDAAKVAAVACGLWPSVVRLIPTQTIDIWLGVWWLCVLLLLSKRSVTISPWILGVVSGMLLGSKYSGGLYLLGLVAVFWKTILSMGRSKVLVWILVTCLVGGIWYLRNFWEMGNWFYPAGESGFGLLGWSGWRTVWMDPVNFSLGILTEYLILPLVWIVSMICRRGPNKFDLLALFGIGVYMNLPAWPVNLLSDLRYLYPAMLPMAVSVWRWGSGEMEKNLQWVFVGCAILAMLQLDFRPKMIVPFLIAGAIWLWRKSKKLPAFV